MNHIVSLMGRLASQDIRLWLEEGNLRYSAPEGAMTPALVDELRRHKTDIVAFLQQSEATQQVTLPLADRSQPMAVSAAQQRLWFLHQLEPDNTAYHIHASLDVSGELNLECLNRALTEIVKRHEILHTFYQQVRGELIQQVAEPYAVALQAEAIDEAALPAAVNAELHHRFDLASPEVFRARLWQLAPARYVLGFTVHHIAADGWSLGTLVGELVSLYQAFSSQQQAALPALSVQYADYALWQHSDAQQQKREQQLAYWQQQLQGVANIDLPLDHARTALTSADGASHELLLNSETRAKLLQFGQQHNATLFMVLMAAYATLLHRYNHQQDFCIGTPVAGRSLSQLEPLIGCFLNLLAIRCEPEAELSFTDFLAQVRETSTQAFANQDIPFEQIVNRIVKDRDLSVSPIFQTMLSVQNAPLAQATAVAGLDIQSYTASEPAAQFDLKLTAQEAGEQLRLHFEYKTALFNRDTIELLAERFQRLLQAVLANPQQKLSEIPLFASNATELLGLEPGGVNDTAVALPEHLLIHRLFEQQVMLTPEAEAVSDASRSLSYQALNEEANRLASLLITAGVQPGQLVGVCMERSVWMSISLLAVLKAGCAYVPFDPSFPEDRLAFMAEDTNISRLLVDRASNDKVAMFCGCSWVVEDLDISQQSTANPNISQANSSLFNVIYTSGSTGKPKGVMVPHQGIANRLLWMQKQYPLTAADKVLQKTPYSFDVSVWELFWPLICGSRYHFAAPEGHKDPAYLRDLIQQQQITTLHFVPSMLATFLNTADIEACSSVRQVFCSGEALQLEHEQGFLTRLPRAKLHNLYGPTEASIDVSYFTCSGQHGYPSVPIGKPIDNIQLHVLDAAQNPLPAGIAGELYIGGIGLAEGYLNRAELTANAFIANPFAGHPSQRLYRTGDLVRQSADGNILYLGRIDHQVKIRGNRIELGEIETALLRHPLVREAVVVAREFNHDKRLVSYLVAQGEAPDADALRRFLSDQLPAYMLPASFMLLDALPLTASGKVNRQRLPEPDWQALSDQPYVEPQTPTQQTLAAIWSEVLGIEKIGIHDNFFQLGGHSLTATQALARAQEAFTVEVPLREVFERPTIAAIAELIDQALLEQQVFAGEASEDEEDQDSFIL